MSMQAINITINGEKVQALVEPRTDASVLGVARGHEVGGRHGDKPVELLFECAAQVGDPGDVVHGGDEVVAGAVRRHAGAHALDENQPLELGKHRRQGEERFAQWRIGVEGLLDPVR